MDHGVDELRRVFISLIECYEEEGATCIPIFEIRRLLHHYDHMEETEK
ncbi:MAG TPA: hypothetical protein PKA28_06715 [Methylomusa anaerophila]|uniref:Uncharacterized protein n=2 Tax=Methylomusa anaerophila TaxID=1930071 RepID=A0A348AGE9_9FIRM|nr:hypothetical protein [Methylomusa anaerophila]BBB90147.1 hypothetical protein MAMMFC1_00795 [Methylomusa anaerophila]HML88128.1 hypothetical protein [Methylomusa anaerophila]